MSEVAMRRMFVLLPAYNEAATLQSQVRAIVAAADLSMPVRIIIGDDGSTDGTDEIIALLISEGLPVEPVHHRINRGLGETSRDLFERAAELARDDDVIIRMDGDDTHEPVHIGAMIAKLDEGYDVVIASRFQPGGGQMGVSRYRAFISRCANVFMSAFFHLRGVRDYSCGYRAYRASIVRRAVAVYGNDFIQLKGLGFTCTLEKLVKLKLLGARFAEVPFMHRYDRKVSVSKMITSVTTLGYVVMTVLYYWPWGGWRVQYRSLRHRASTPIARDTRPNTTTEPKPVATGVESDVANAGR